MKTRAARLVLIVVSLTLVAVAAAACGGAKKTAAAKPAATAPMVTTLAGKAGAMGTANGCGAAARFTVLLGVACGAAGVVSVADDNTIRKISAAGVVTTLVGKAGASGSADGVGDRARFYNPSGIVCDASGNLYVADSANRMIRKITPAAVVTIVAGQGRRGSADGRGLAAGFNCPGDIACDAAGDLFVADTNNATIRKISWSH